MGKKERLFEFNRSNILMASKQLFQEKGVVQTTVDDIAKRAEYSKSTLYVYFKSKEEICNQIILEDMIELKQILTESLQRYPGFPEGFFAICDALVRFYDTNPLYFESIMCEIKLPKDETETLLTQIYEVGEAVNAISVEYIKNCVLQHNIVLTIPPLQASFTLWASISGIILLANNKEAYMNKAMGISKDKFMKDGFKMLLKSFITGEE